MRYSILVAALVASVANAADHLIQVGAGDELVFSPSNITAATGDTISFQFQNKNHSVTQSTFPAPCTKMTTPTIGVDSGFQFVAANSTTLPQFTIAVNTTSPLWFYCAQTNPISHCESGMVFAVNAPANKTFAQFQAAAKALNTSASSSSSSGSSGYGSTPAASTAAAAGATGTSASGSTGSAASPSSSSSSSTKNGALRIGGSAAGALAVAAVLVGLV